MTPSSIDWTTVLLALIAASIPALPAIIVALRASKVVTKAVQEDIPAVVSDVVHSKLQSVIDTTQSLTAIKQELLRQPPPRSSRATDPKPPVEPLPPDISHQVTEEQMKQ